MKMMNDLWPFLISVGQLLIAGAFLANVLRRSAPPQPKRDWTDYVFGVAVALTGAGKRLTGADILNSFLVDLLAQSGQLAQFPHLQAYWQRLNTHPARQKAAALERELDRSAE